MPLNPGDIVGGYEVIGPLGTGGMASVFHARHQVLGSDHALKILRSELVARPAIRRRFLDEGRVQAQLRHPGIVRVTGIVSEPGVAGLVMDLLVGSSLEQVLQRRGAIPLPEAAGLLLQALDAVGFAHTQGVVHRDLKPGNLFLVDEDRPSLRVLDFGIAKVAGSGNTRSGGTLGTYGFMAPEQLHDASDVDGRADVFALGAVLYELLCGVPAFDGATDFELMQHVSQGAYDASLLPAAITEVVQRALTVDRADRYQLCREFARALERFAPPEALALVQEWESNSSDLRDLSGQLAGVAGVEATWERRSLPTIDAEIEPVGSSDASLDPAPLAIVDPTPLSPVSSTDLVERQEILIRVAGAAQLLTGFVNTFFLWMLSCYGYPKVFGVAFNLLGLPGFLQSISFCGGVLGLGLLVIGPLEILAGVRAQMRGRAARGVVRRTATLQMAALAFGGIPSFFVGAVITALLWFSPAIKEEA